jgi:hypothetical protein
MHTTPRAYLRSDPVRPAVVAAVISFVLPLLPVYGLGGRAEFVFSVGFSVRGLVSFFLFAWTNLAVVTVGILFLRQDRPGPAGGLFTAVALILAITITRQALETAPQFIHWQSVVIYTLEVTEVFLLSLAAVRAIGASGS